jgi:hypothetical protein
VLGLRVLDAANAVVSSWSYQSRHHIGIFFAASIAVGDAVAGYLEESRIGEVIREGFLIGGWVAMWRSLEIFLYDWRPIRADGRLLQRLSTMPVRIEYNETAPADAWRSDWGRCVADYSALSAATGSTWAARYAGLKTAITRTTASASSAPIHDHGSSAST